MATRCKTHTSPILLFLLIFNDHISTVLFLYCFKYVRNMIIKNMNKPRVMWKFIKQLLPGKSKNGPHCTMIEDKLVTDEYLPQNVDTSFKFTHITLEFV